jgi:hypothetical protein
LPKGRRGEQAGGGSSMVIINPHENRSKRK